MVIEGLHLNLVRVIYDWLTETIFLNGEKLKAFPLRSRTKQGRPLPSLVFNIVLKVLATAIREEKNKNGESAHPRLVSDLRGNAFSLSPLSMMLAIRLLYMVFII